MTVELEWIPRGGITSPAGWEAGAVYTGIKTYGVEPRFDLALLASDRPCSVAGLFTRNRVCGAPVQLCRERIAKGTAQAIIANSGCSNVAMGERGALDAHRMTRLAASKLGIDVESVLVASTGVIGRPLPMEKIEASVSEIALSSDGGDAFARAIMTTDTVPKNAAIRFRAFGRTYTVGGVAKGSGMVHPDMATVFCFVTTDARVSIDWLREATKRACDLSLNMIDVDMDTSTSDTMLVFANGAAGGDPIDESHPAAEAFSRALDTVAIELARKLARDGEGARTLIEVSVNGATTLDDARRAARTVASSPLVKTMVTGRDPNSGRILMAIGRSGAELDLEKIQVWIGRHPVFVLGAPSEVDYESISREMDGEEVKIRVDLGLGSQRATAWGCDLTEEYVRINASYTT